MPPNIYKVLKQSNKLFERCLETFKNVVGSQRWIISLILSYVFYSTTNIYCIPDQFLTLTHHQK